MCVVHNAVLRGLNSIYVQGPNVQPADYLDFIGYSLCWHSVIHEHHTSEEEQFFPEIEEAVDEKGLLDGNVEQHSKQNDFLSIPSSRKATLENFHLHILLSMNYEMTANLGFLHIFSSSFTQLTMYG